MNQIQYFSKNEKENIKASTIKKLADVCQSDPNFTEASVLKCNYATKFLYKWCIAMIDYYHIFTETAPLRDKLEEMKKIVKEKTEELRIKKAELDKINKKIEELQRNFEAKKAESERL